MSDFIIVGGGVIGLLLARELVASGATVNIVEKGQCCREASWAGGGIVSPLYPWRYSAPVTALASWAQDFYPQLSASLYEETGIDPQLRQTGLLMLHAEDEIEALAWAQKNQKPMQQVDKAFIYQQEENLGVGFDNGLWMPGISNVRNPSLGRALRQSLLSHSSAQVTEGAEVKSLLIEKEKIIGVAIEQAGAKVKLLAKNTVITAGAWSARVLAAININLPVTPVKGQMLLFQAVSGLIKSIVLKDGRYLIPRLDGHILVGSTLEHTDFDKSTSEEAKASLQASAFALLPALQDYPLRAHWAGLRPFAPSGVPFIGAVGGWQNLYINAGHYRNGLVLAPASARLLADLLLGRTPIVDPRPYALSVHSFNL